MIIPDIDALKTFGYVKTSENHLIFKGYEDSLCALNKTTHDTISTPNYFNIINPTNCYFPQTFYVFQNLKDALIFFCKRNLEYFNSSIIVITSNAIDNVVKKLVTKYQTKEKQFKCYHIENDFSLIIFQINLLNIDLYYNIKYNIKDIYINISYKSNDTTLDFRQSLSFQKIFNVLNSRRYKFANLFIENELSNSLLIIH